LWISHWISKKCVIQATDGIKRWIHLGVVNNP
jgi:hypothetical protein